MKRLAASLLCLAMAGSAQAEPVAISSAPIADFGRISSDVVFGPFTWRGGLTLTAEEAAFGGLSGLAIGPSCEPLLAVSDKGSWLEATLTYDGERLSGVAGARLSPMLDSEGQRLRTKARGDAEALVRLASGKLLVGFEGMVRFGRYDVARQGTRARFTPLPHPKDMDDGPRNSAIEAVGELADGRILAIAEGRYDADGNIRAWAWKDWRTTLFAIARHDEYRVTDLTVLPDGSVLTLERRFSRTSVPGMAIRRFPAAAIRPGAIIMPELLMEATAPAYIIDNMEGIAACQRNGETLVTLISDDNFNRAIQSTILLQFGYRP